MNDQADGTPVPDDLKPLWEGKSEVLRLVTALNNIALVMRSARDLHDPQYAEVNIVDVLSQVKLLKAQLERAVPYAVCPACQGVMRASCKLCKGRGAISKFLWDSPAVRDTIKQLRAKVKK